MMWLNGMILATALVLSRETPDSDTVSAARAAVTSAEVSFGPAHPATGMILRNLALVYQEAGFYNRAEATAQRSLAILEDAFGPADISLTPVLNVLTETYVSQGRYIEARRTGMRALEIGPGAGAHFATALHNLGALDECVGKLDEATEYYRRALLARQELLPPGHVFIGVTRAALARVETAEAMEARKASRHSYGNGLLRGKQR